MVDQQEKRITIGKPVLVCRWRLSQGALPLLERHMKALAARSVKGKPVTPELVGWAKQHIEWTLNPKNENEKNGVLMLVVDGEGKAAMSIGPYRALALCSDGDSADSLDRALLIERAQRAQKEASQTGVAPEVLWAVHIDGTKNAARDPADCSGGRSDYVHAKPQLIIGVPQGSILSGLNSLIFDLAKTKGYEVTFDPEFIEHIEEASGASSKQDVQDQSQDRKTQMCTSSGSAYDEIFLVSDEYGIVGDSNGVVTSEFTAYYDKLLKASASF